MRLESEQFATFVPADPPGAGALAVWGDGQGADELDLVLPAGGRARRRRVRGRLLPVGARKSTVGSELRVRRGRR